MKRLLLLSLVFVSLTASAFDVPRYYLPAIKPAFSAPFIKETYKPTNNVIATNQPGSESPLEVTLFIEGWYRDIAFQSYFVAAPYVRVFTVTATINEGIGTVGHTWFVPIGACCMSSGIAGLQFRPTAIIVSGTASLTRYMD